MNLIYDLSCSSIIGAIFKSKFMQNIATYKIIINIFSMPYILWCCQPWDNDIGRMIQRSISSMQLNVQADWFAKVNALLHD